MIDKKILEESMRSFMYVHPAKRRTMKHLLTFLAVAGIVAAIPISASLMPAPNASASVFPKIVDGTVRDLNGLPVPDANVTVRTYNLAVLVGTQYYTPLTEPDGTFSVTFDPAQWDPGYTITVTATKDFVSGTNSTIADGLFFQTVNATIGFYIPEFSSSVIVVAGGFVLVAILAVRARIAAK